MNTRLTKRSQHRDAYLLHVSVMKHPAAVETREKPVTDARKYKSSARRLRHTKKQFRSSGLPKLPTC